MSQVYYNSKTGEQYIVPVGAFGTSGFGMRFGPADLAKRGSWQSYIDRGMVKVIGAPSSSQNNLFNAASISRDYTPNQYTARQLGELQSGALGGGGNTIPMWMHNAFANKMGRLGAPANGPLPYQLTASSFRGMPAGKAAPTGGK